MNNSVEKVLEEYAGCNARYSKSTLAATHTTDSSRALRPKM